MKGQAKGKGLAHYYAKMHKAHSKKPRTITPKFAREVYQAIKKSGRVKLSKRRGHRKAAWQLGRNMSTFAFA